MNGQIIEQCKKANLSNRALLSTDIGKYNFDCNIQQIKTIEFDELYYGLFFADVVEIFRMTSKQVLNTEGYSNKQHRGNVGEGQFHLNQSNIDYNRKNFLVEKLTYEQLYQLFL